MMTQFTCKRGRRAVAPNWTSARALLALGATWCLGLLPALPAAPPPRPNIIIILADDMGFSDPGCFGGEIHTPNIDRLAADGLRFTRFYNASRCCPTRAALLTGQYPHKVGLARNGRSLTFNGLTIAEALREAGYRTAMSGKWHLSRAQTLPNQAQHQAWLDHRFDPGRPFAPRETYPASRGFQHHFGIIWGVADYFDPFSLVDGLAPVREVPEGFYLTDALADRAADYIREFAKAGEPFFLYLAFTAPHWPLHARPEDIANYRGKYVDGWHALRERRRARQLELGLYDPAVTPLPELMGNGPDWPELTPAERRLQASKLAVHAAMVDRLDQGIGRVLATLESTATLDNTVIFFLSDNGASPETPRQPGYDRSSTTRDGRPIRYRGFAPEATGAETTYCGIGSWWANAVNTPFRYWKAESFEGGSHTPFIVHWPAGLKAKPGGICREVGHVIDLLPTCLELAGAEYPATYHGHQLTAMDGRSLVPVLTGGNREPHRALFFEHEGGRAMRAGDWKLVKPRRGGGWELYNLARDATETRDLAGRYPARVKAMAARWQRWYDEAMSVGSAHAGTR